MRYSSMCCIFLFSISLFQCYGMEDDDDNVSKDIFAMEEGRLPAKGNDVVDKLNLYQFGFDANHIEQIKKQLNDMGEEERSDILDSNKNRGFNQFSPMFQQPQQQQQNQGLFGRIFANQNQGAPMQNNNYENQMRLMEILYLVKDLHAKLFSDHSSLQECHTNMEDKLKKKERCAKLHKFAEGGLTVFGMVIGSAITYFTSRYLGG